MNEKEKISNLLSKITVWAKEKGLHLLTPLDQLPKLNEEYGELNKAFLKNDKIQLADGIGDTLVVCSVIMAQYEQRAKVFNLADYYYTKLKGFSFGNKLYDLQYQLSSFIEQAVVYFDVTRNDSYSERRVEYVKQAFSRVVLTMQAFCEEQDIFLSDALNMALTTISFRSGEIVNGVFVKREPNTVICVPYAFTKLSNEKLIEKINEYALQNEIKFFKIEFTVNNIIEHKGV